MQHLNEIKLCDGCLALMRFGAVVEGCERPDCDGYAPNGAAICDAVIVARLALGK